MKTFFDVAMTAAALVGGLAALFGMAVGLVLLVKVWAINRDAYREATRMQGGFRNALRGKLRDMPDKNGDFRVVRGLVWDPKGQRYEPHGALSSEAFRSAFPR